MTLPNTKHTVDGSEIRLTTWNVQNHVKNGISATFPSTGAGFQPSTVALNRKGSSPKHHFLEAFAARSRECISWSEFGMFAETDPLSNEKRAQGCLGGIILNSYLGS